MLTVEVTGTAVRSRPSTTHRASSASMSGEVWWGHLGQTARQHNPAITVGVASTLPGRTGSPARGPLAGTWTTTSRPTSRPSSRPSSGTPIPVGNSPFGPVETPAYANTLARSDRGGSTRAVGPVKLQPPFLGENIELLISAPDCAEFNFDVKMFAPSSTKVGSVSVNLPALANIPSYVPPPVTDVMSISFTSGRPVYGVKTSSGVSAACLPAYFEASDAYRQRLENEVGYLAGRTSSAQAVVSQTNQRSDVVDTETLRAHGCGCSSTTLTFSSTDKNVQKEHPDYFGSYKYKVLYTDCMEFSLLHFMSRECKAATRTMRRQQLLLKRFSNISNNRSSFLNWLFSPCICSSRSRAPNGCSGQLWELIRRWSTARRLELARPPSVPATNRRSGSG